MELKAFESEDVPGARTTLHPLLIGEGGARFDSDEAAEAERRMWVAVQHEPGGIRRYFGIAPAEGDGQDRAMAGDADVATLSAAELEAVRQAMLLQDAHAWDDATETVRLALDPPETNSRTDETS